MGVEQDGKVEVHGYVTVDRSRSGMLDGGWNFSWDDCGVSVEDEEVGEVMSLVGFLVRHNLNGFWNVERVVSSWN